MAFVLKFCQKCKSALKKRRKVFALLAAVSVSALLAVAFHLNARKLRPSIHRKPLVADRSADVVTAADGPFRPALRVVHLDLKGAPPRLRFLSQILPVLSTLGANALLVEYEDMFPFSGPLEAVRALNAYSEADVRELARLAAHNNLELIPLVQTFGHLEFALKTDAFADLREAPALPQTLCPKHNRTMALIHQMVDQVLALHPRARFLHIGCDEVFQLALCARCRLDDRDRLFVSHVRRVADYVISAHRVVPIVWDDMLRQMAPDVIRESGLGSRVEPMVWSYVSDIYRFVPESQWQQFAQLFPRIWFASAFKGAFGETLTVPNALWHLRNNRAWLDVGRQQARHFRQVRGLVLTGWQRYDHLAALCELLPAALPSLALSLATVSMAEDSDVFARFDRALRCPDGGRALTDDQLEMDANLFGRARGCQFPGAEVFQTMQTHADVTKRVTDYLYDVTEHKAWLTDYNVRHNLSNPYRVDEGLQDFQSVHYALLSFARSAKAALERVFDASTAFEWIEQNVYPLMLRMERLRNQSLALKRASRWPRRPLQPWPDLVRRLAEDSLNGL